MSLKTRPITFLILAIVILILGNPTEDKFLQRVTIEYGQAHAEMNLNREAFLSMGTSSYKSYFLLSTYEYSFGNIGVRYIGVAFMTFHLGSFQNLPEEQLYES